MCSFFPETLSSGLLAEVGQNFSCLSLLNWAKALKFCKHTISVHFSAHFASRLVKQYQIDKFWFPFIHSSSTFLAIYFYNISNIFKKFGIQIQDFLATLFKYQFIS